MQHVLLIENPLDRQSWHHVETEDVRALICERFAEWPSSGRIYAGPPAEMNDITPRSVEDVERLPSYPVVTVVIYPEHPAIILIAVVAIAIIATVALMLFLPSIPDLKNQQNPSPNNGLSDRANRARPLARIPDIFGQVHSIPDLIAVPYRVYESHREVEITYMCVGRGTYEIDDVRDGDTKIADIQGASAAIYGPGKSPNNGPPDIQIGSAIGDPVFNTSRLNEVNGQVLKAPNDTAVRADQEISFADGGIVQAAGGSIDFTDFFAPGDEVEIGRATDAGDVENADPVFGEARGAEPDSLIFTIIDPSAYFQAGQEIEVSGAIFTAYDGSAPTGGGGVDFDGGYADGAIA